MIDHSEDVRKANEENDLLFGTVESWIVYVRLIVLVIRATVTTEQSHSVSPVEPTAASISRTSLMRLVHSC